MNNITNTAYFFDLDYTLWNTDAKWWVIDKNNPEKALYKIPQHEGYLIANGFYSKFGFQIYYNGYFGWLSEEMYKDIISKGLTLDDIGISLREYKDKDLIDKQILNMFIYINNIKHIQNKTQSINLLTARQNKAAHVNLLNTLREKLFEYNISINHEYFVNDPNEIKCVATVPEKKLMVLLQHLVGYKLHGREFKPIVIDRYDTIHFYDDESLNIDECKKINEYLKMYCNNSVPFMQEKIFNSIRTRKPKLYLQQVTTNELNPFIETIVEINI